MYATLALDSSGFSSYSVDLSLLIQKEVAALRKRLQRLKEAIKEAAEAGHINLYLNICISQLPSRGRALYIRMTAKHTILAHIQYTVRLF